VTVLDLTKRFHLVCYSITIDSLLKRLKRTKCDTEKHYLYFQLTKFYLRKGKRKNLLIAEAYASKCLVQTNEKQNYWWFINALFVSSSVGFQLNRNKRHLDELEVIIKGGELLNLPEISKFAIKVRRST